MSSRSSWLVLAVASLAPATALADTVVLSDGQEVSGVVSEGGDRVTVDLDIGSVSFPRSEVASIRRESTPLHDFEQRRAKLDPNDVTGRLALARWAEQNGLDGSARQLYREVLVMRPDDATAREHLGYQKHDGRWLSEDEYLRATGHVRYGGAWVTQDEADRLEREGLERRERQNADRIKALEAQVDRQNQEITELESTPTPEPESTYLGFGGWWYPGWLPRMGYHRRGRPAPQANLRGRLQTHRGGSISGHASVQRHSSVRVDH